MSFWSEGFWSPGFWTAGFWSSVAAEPGAPTISIDQGASVVVLPAGTRQLTATVDGDPAPDVTWESSDEGVATVDSEGLVTGVAPGSATITATATNTEGSAQDSILVQVAAEIEADTGDEHRPRIALFA